jgi:hypothetical protein
LSTGVNGAGGLLPGISAICLEFGVVLTFGKIFFESIPYYVYNIRDISPSYHAKKKLTILLCFANRKLSNGKSNHHSNLVVFYIAGRFGLGDSGPRIDSQHALVFAAADKPRYR